MEVGGIVLFPVLIIPFPVLKINVDTFSENFLQKKVFLSVSWKLEKSYRKVFIRGLEVGEIIPYPVWKILFPVLKNQY